MNRTIQTEPKPKWFEYVLFAIEGNLEWAKNLRRDYYKFRNAVRDLEVHTIPGLLEILKASDDVPLGSKSLVREKLRQLYTSNVDLQGKIDEISQLYEE